MSIVALNKVTFAGLTTDKQTLLDDLQRLGCLELIPLGSSEKSGPTPAPAGRTREALRFLVDCPQQRLQSRNAAKFDASAVERRVLALKDRIQDLEHERDFLIGRIRDFKPWGDFHLPPLDEMGGLRLWFYTVPQKDLSKLENVDLCWEIVARSGRSAHVVVVSPEEPQGMPVERTHLGSRSRSELETHLEEVELAIEDAQARRAHLTRWRTLFGEAVEDLEAQADRERASLQTCDEEPLFGLQGWAPKENVEELRDYAKRHALYFESSEPGPDDDPPTLLRNGPGLSAGEGLVNFYMTPGYRTWDPSVAVFISFSIFFAMILADAGYALLLGLGLLIFWKKMGRSAGGRSMRSLLLTIIGASLVYGVLVGSYFGIAPPKETFFGRLHLLDMNNANAMMAVSICIGALHVVLANLMNAHRFGWRAQALPPVGWACIVGGGLVAAAGALLGIGALKSLGGLLAIGGAILVFAFAGIGKPLLGRIMAGVLALTKITSAFGDVLSYLRLFALGLASASLALAFNDMASQIRHSLPRFGILIALFLFILGHGLNLLLGISGGVIHGLRLNVIEFFNWGLPEEGRSFKPFKR